ncbi:MAG: PTS sugar transporter subunit IIA [Negativicutes bacterium]|jgi:PTS system fructose-specific IIA component
MDIANFVEKENIVIGVDAADKAQTIGKLAEILEQNGKLVDKNGYIAAVLEREEHFTTGIGNGIAIPHGKTDCVKLSSIAIAKLKQPVEWQAMDDQPVDLVFLLAIQDSDASDLHLKLLQQIAVKLMDDEIVAALKSATTAEAIISALQRESEF